MRLAEGENHLISERDGLVICQVWSRPDLSTEDGARNAAQLVAFMTNVVLRAGTQFRGFIFDVRRGPAVFGPKTREAMAGLLLHSVARNVKVAILCSESATQVLQFRSLCTPTPNMTQIFDSEPAAVQWLRSTQTPKR